MQIDGGDGDDGGDGGDDGGGGGDEAVQTPVQKLLKSACRNSRCLKQTCWDNLCRDKSCIVRTGGHSRYG